MRFGEERHYVIEKLVAALSYWTMGFVGFLWLVLGAFTKHQSSNFVKYHIFQAIFISIALFLLNCLFGIISDMLSIIPFIKVIVANIYYLLNVPIFLNYSVIQCIFYLFLLYATVTSAMGLYTYIPFVSDVIAQNFGRR